MLVDGRRREMDRREESMNFPRVSQLIIQIAVRLQSDASRARARTSVASREGSATKLLPSFRGI